MRVAGAPGALTIRRDRYGVAYVDAEDDAGAWFGLGFCQAQDRAFQLDIRLRTLRGTLSQLFGETTVAIDRLARRVGFVDAARRQWASLDADVRAQIEAFVRGINAGLAASTRPRRSSASCVRSHANGGLKTSWRWASCCRSCSWATGTSSWRV